MGDYYEETLLWDFTNDRMIHEIRSDLVSGIYSGEDFTRQGDTTWYKTYYTVYEHYIQRRLQARKELYHVNVAREKEKQKAGDNVALLERACKILGDSLAIPVIMEKIDELKKHMAWKPHRDSSWKIPNDVDIVTRDRERSCQ